MDLEQVIEFIDAIFGGEESAPQSLEERREVIMTYEDVIAEGLDVVPIMGGWTVGYGPNGCSRIDVMRILFNYRITETSLPDTNYYSRHWCCDGRKLADAVMAAREWAGDPYSEPQGWIKAWDGRIGGRLAKEHLERIGKHAKKLPVVSASASSPEAAETPPPPTEARA